MDIFISYASEQRTLAEEIALALRGEGHQVFFDRTQLTDGDGYNAALREAIESADLLVFLVSPEAVKGGRYTLTELGLAQEKWPSPTGHVLPVLVQPTDAEKTLNGFKLRTPREIDWKKQYESACEAFSRNGFFVLVGDYQAETLEEEITVSPGTVISFVKLVPLVGG